MRRPVMRCLALGSAVLSALLSVDAGRAYEYPSVERGIKPERAFFVGDIDQVRLFNGGILISIPIGQRFQVGPELSYALTLTYNGQVWEYQGAETGGGAVVTQAWPARGSNAGLGWRLSLGEFLYPGTIGPGTCADCYVAPDGAQHQFYDTLHQDLPPDGSPMYTRDGTYLRLRTVSGGREIDFPNGIIHKFDSSGRLVRMSDPFGNWVEVEYGASSWTIRDTHGREHTVNFTAVAYYGTAVDNVVLDAFAGSEVTYDFTYSQQAVPRSCLDTDDQTSPTINVPLLTEVKLPPTSPGESSVYSMPVSSYHLSSIWPSTCEGPFAVAPLEGLLEAVKLPTLGSVEWAYATFLFPVPVPPEQPDAPWLQKTAGVATRTLRDATGAAVGTWTYTQQPLNLANAVESITRLTTPLLDYTDHYFRVGSEPEVLYGLPISQQESAPGRPDVFRSSKVYDCNTAGSSCVLKRTTYLKYQVDAVNPGPDPEYNPRVEASYTKFDDDGTHWSAVDYSRFDGLGHYRAMVTSGNFDAGNARTEYVDYNSESGIYPGSFTMPTGDKWVLNNYGFRWESEGGVTAARSFVMDPDTGWVSRTRMHRTDIAGTPQFGDPPGGETTTDVIVETLDDGFGYLASERYYGGDSQPVSTAPLASLNLPATPTYRIDHHWLYGTRAGSSYTNGTGAPLSFNVLDCGDDPATEAFDPGIDRSTGLLARCRDTSRIATSYEYDALGRTKWIKPESGQEGWTELSYVAATSASALAKVTIQRRANGGGTVLAESNIQFDAFGRLWREQRERADGTFSTRETLYDGMGHVASVSQEGNLDKKTEYVGYDAFGRPSEIVAADGHSATFTYAGDRSLSRSVSVADIVGDEHRAWTTEIRDRQGRLYQVKEEAEANFTNTTTTYFYDVGGRLVQSRQATSAGTQNRFFTYDQRGFLLKERHPEKGGAGGDGIVFFGDYDARGHAGRRYECAAMSCVNQPSQRVAQVKFEYDRAERLLNVIDETPSPARLLKSFEYGTSNAAGVRTNGRILTATRYNYQTTDTAALTIKIDETYVYGGKGGRPSSRTTQLTSWTAANPTPVPGERFSQGWVYTELGHVKDVTYPRCAAGPCLNLDSARTITNSYANGWLTAVTGTGGASYASAITYHPNGMVKKIARSNGVSLNVGLDASYIPRPASFATAGAPVNWTSGAYKYDGAGNVTRIGESRFTYDHVSRIKTANLVVEAAGLPFADGFETGDLGCWAPGTCLGGASAATQTYTYDPFGNLNEIGGTPGRLTPTNPATNRLDGATYDVPGNMLTWNGDTYEYDALGIVTRRCPGGCTAGAHDWRYVYTADDERLWTIKVGGAGGNNVWTLRDLGGSTLREYDALASWAARDYVYREGQLLASNFPGEGDRHFHLDHLGTPRLITNSTGAMVAYHSYFPFGEEATAATQDAERRKFTGHERDTLGTSSADDDRDYMHARYYLPLTARFLGVDPTLTLARAARQPQAWNRYAYTIGNPLKFVDPGGDIYVVSACASGGKGNECDQQKSMLQASLGDSYSLISINKDGTLSIKGSADAFARRGTYEQALAALIGSNHTFTLFTGRSAATDVHGGAYTAPVEGGGANIYIDNTRSRFQMGDIAGGTAGDTLVHETGHAVGYLYPLYRDVIEKRYGLSVSFLARSSREGYAVAFENRYRSERGKELRGYFFLPGDVLFEGKVPLLPPPGWHLW